MKHVAILVAICAGVFAQDNSKPNPYRTIENWAKLPEGRTWGSTSAVDIDRDGRSVWVAERCGANSCAGKNDDSVLHFDASGKLIKSFGAGMFLFPHGIAVDKDGNVWITDGQQQGGKGFTVVKFSPDGKVLMTLDYAFNQPNDVAVAPTGDIFVSEGHTAGMGTPQILKFSKDGKFLTKWGQRGSGPGELDVPHTLAFDSRGRLFVGDRANNRIQIFDQDGKFLDQWKQFSRPSGLYIDKNDILYVTDSESTDKQGYGYNPGWKRGIRIGSAKDGVVTAFIPDPFVPAAGAALPATSAAEGVAVDADGVIYGAEVGSKSLKRYVKTAALPAQAKAGKYLELAGVECMTPPALHCGESNCPGAVVTDQGTAIEPKTGRKFFLDYPCDLKRDEKITFVLSLHGGGSYGNWQRHYFPIMDYAQKYRLLIATPNAPPRVWAQVDDEYLQNIVNLVYQQVGQKNIKAFWLAGHSQGGMTSNRLVRTDFFKQRVDGWLSLSGGRLGPAPPIPVSFFTAAAGGQAGGPPRGGLPTAPQGLPDATFSFIFETGEHELGDQPIPDGSPWATKLGCGARVRRADVTDTKAGYVYDSTRQNPGSDAWGRLPRPGSAEVFEYPRCKDGRVVADVVRVGKGHTEGLEPHVTEQLVKLMVSAKASGAR